MNFLNEDLCTTCKGICCKRGGCDYSANDFSEIKLQYLMSKLESGYISIVSTQCISMLPNGKYVNTPFLYLKARNIDRPIVDLLSINNTCKSLTSTGCRYNSHERPSGGLNLVPKRDEKGFCCTPHVPPFEIIKTWEPYQKILYRLVKRLTHKTVDEVLREDVTNLFYDYMCTKFRDYDEAEVEDILDLIPKLALVYPLEYEKALERKNNSYIR